MPDSDSKRRLRKRRLRYRHDAAWRESRKAKVKEYRDRYKRVPEFRALENVRKAIYRTRESYEARRAHAERLFEHLQELLGKVPGLSKAWQEARARLEALPNTSVLGYPDGREPPANQKGAQEWGMGVGAVRQGGGVNGVSAAAAD